MQLSHHISLRSWSHDLRSTARSGSRNCRCRPRAMSCHAMVVSRVRCGPASTSPATLDASLLSSPSSSSSPHG